MKRIEGPHLALTTNPGAAAEKIMEFIASLGTKSPSITS